jgi:hypothetical protein
MVVEKKMVVDKGTATETRRQQKPASPEWRGYFSSFV